MPRDGWTQATEASVWVWGALDAKLNGFGWQSCHQLLAFPHTYTSLLSFAVFCFLFHPSAHLLEQRLLRRFISIMASAVLDGIAISSLHVHRQPSVSRCSGAGGIVEKALTTASSRCAIFGLWNSMNYRSTPLQPHAFAVPGCCKSIRHMPIVAPTARTTMAKLRPASSVRL